MQVRETELHRSELPAMRDGRTQGRRVGGKEGPASRQHLLWLLELPKVRVHFRVQTCCRGMSGVRQLISAREEFESRYLPGVPKQQAHGLGGGRASAETQEEAGKGQRRGCG